MTDSPPDADHRKVLEEAEAAPHAYDNPNLSATEFLLAVMRDQRVPLSVRMDAAKALMPLGEEDIIDFRWDAVTNAEYTITYIIPPIVVH